MNGRRTLLLVLTATTFLTCALVAFDYPAGATTTLQKTRYLTAYAASNETDAAWREQVTGEIPALEAGITLEQETNATVEIFMLLGRLYFLVDLPFKGVASYAKSFDLFEEQLFRVQKHNAKTGTPLGSISNVFPQAVLNVMTTESLAMARLLFIAYAGGDRKRFRDSTDLREIGDDIDYVTETWGHYDDLIYLNAVIAYVLENYERVVKTVENIRRITDYPYAERFLGLAYLFSFRETKGLFYIKRTLKRIEPYVLFHDKAVLAYKEGDVDTAWDLLLEAEATEEANGRVYYNLGRLYKEDEDIAKAKHYFEKAYEANPGYTLPIYALGLVMLEVADYENALNYFEEVNDNITTKEGMGNNLIVTPYLYNNLAVCYTRKSRPDLAQALTFSQKAIAEYGVMFETATNAQRAGDPRLYDTQAEIYAEQKNYLQAIATLEKALTILDAIERQEPDSPLLKDRDEYLEKKATWKRKTD